MKRSCLLLSLLVTVLLSGCLSPVKPDQTSSYVLNKIPHIVPHKASHQKILLVVQPETSPAYNTTQMAYTVKPYQVAYFGKNQWAETPAQMLQPLIMQTLQNTHYYHAIVSPPYLGGYDYFLSTHILQLQQDFIRDPSVVELNVRAVLTNVHTNRVVATKQFKVRTTINRQTPYGGVIAANIAVARFLEELANFCLKHS